MMGIGKKQPQRRSSAVALDLLTPREREVLVAVANGLTNRQTGELLGISHRTVEVHRARLMRKLEVQSVAQLVALYLLKGVPRPGIDSAPTP
ncbi:response regulator transcription factor [Sphingobium sp. Cam5-1]|uniref:response regulator transcription factor n=1 Tax=Sphingobium sp. Cam5-1 TaxID=2789327 RepID=UPI0018AD1773|nr:helix-turn-helix transcriptional regulator [Sphingobium sp. Cam5-1]QPI74688.1 helix-turn-helix transcriptional regulator [Sphingobium sp. Cam5-1]